MKTCGQEFGFRKDVGESGLRLIKIFICILVALSLPTVLIWGNFLRPEMDSTVFNFYEDIEKIAFN